MKNKQRQASSPVLWPLHLQSNEQSLFRETCWDYANLAVTDDLFHRAIFFLQVSPIYIQWKVFYLCNIVQAATFSLHIANISGPANVFTSIVLKQCTDIYSKHLLHSNPGLSISAALEERMWGFLCRSTETLQWHLLLLIQLRLCIQDDLYVGGKAKMSGTVWVLKIL